jgi:serine/threonine protein kinase
MILYIMFKFLKKDIFTKTQNSVLYKKNNYIIKQTNILDTNQYNILKNIKHSNIIKIIHNYCDLDYNYDIMKYYKNGDLYDNITSNMYNLNNRIKNQNIIEKLINPIYYIHKKNIVHLDLKLENYLIDNNGDFILCDFDISKYHKNVYNYLEKTDTIGTKAYMAPELFEGYYSKTSDIYSLGVIIYLLYTKTLYKNNIDYSLLNNIPLKIIDMIEKSLRTNPKERPTIFDYKYYYLT